MLEPLVLYMDAFWCSPWDATVHVALREKGLSFHTSISMMGPGVGVGEAMLERTYTGTAPVLQHGSFWVAESLAIVEYLDEAYPPPQWPGILPDDVRDRARARQLLSWLRASLEPLRRERPIEAILYRTRVVPPPLSPAAAKVAERLVRVAERLGAGPSGCLLGGRFGAVDVEMAFALMRLVWAGAPVPGAVAAYATAVWDRPSVREFVDHPRPPYAPPVA